MRKLWILPTAVVLIVTAFFFLRGQSRPEVEVLLAELSLGSKGSISGGKSDGQMMLETRAEGEARIWLHSSERLLKLRWKPVYAISVSGQADLESVKAINALPEQELFLQFSEAGVFESLWYREEAALKARDQVLLLNFHKLAAHQAAWLMLERLNCWERGADLWGNFSVTAPVQREEESLKLSARTNSPSPSGLAADTTLVIALKAGAPLSVRTEQTLRLSAEMGSSENILALQVKDRTSSTLSLQQEFSAFMKTARKSTPWMLLDGAETRRATLTETLQGWDSARLEKALFAANFPKGTPHAKILPLSKLLNDMLFLHPQLAEQYKAWALKLGSRNPLFDSILQSLRFQGDDHSQRILRELAEHFEADLNSARRVLLALGFTEHPNRETQDWLMRQVSEGKGEYAGTAELMLGSAGEYLAREGQSSGRAREVEQFLMDRLRNPEGDIARENTLVSLGNLGSCATFEIAESRLSSENRNERENALMALRLCKEPRVADLYRKAWGREELRSIVLQALGKRLEASIRDPGIYQFLAEYFASTPKVEKEIAGALLGLLDQYARIDEGFAVHWKSQRAR